MPNPSHNAPPVPGQPSQAGGSFRRLMRRIAPLAAAVHGVFLILFAWLGITPMVALNLASVMLYLAAWWGADHPRWRVAVPWAMGAEVLLHAVLAVVLIGWDSGFHHYVVLILPVLIMSAGLSPQRKLAGAFAVITLYLSLDMSLRHAQPPWRLPATTMDVIHAFNTLCALALMSILAATYYRLVVGAEAGLKNMASTDALTGLMNRRSLLEGAHWASQGRRAVAMTVLMADIDHFKSVNDQHGHEAGDQALRAVAKAMSQGLRQGDMLARWGGEEFLMLLPGNDLSAARMVAERLRALVQEAAFRLSEQGPLLPLSVSLGVGLWEPDEDLDSAIARVDAALYQAKAHGRNRVHVAAHP
jgi:diguanylate cyclase (GGDEF)-like protein